MRLKLSVLLFFIGINASLYAQYEITIEAFLLDKQTEEPIPYANIGFIDKGIGTVSDLDGKFSLTYNEDEITLKDILQISVLGYETLAINTRQLIRGLTNTNKIYLIPKPEVLDDVFLNYVEVQERLGYSGGGTSAMGYWKDKTALGGEIAQLIKIDHEDTKLLDLKFNIIENSSDSLKIRINVYEYYKRFPQEKLIKTNIFHTIIRSEGEESIDLSPYNIRVDDDVVISIELLEVYGSDINFAISALSSMSIHFDQEKGIRSKIKGASFLRYKSQDKWDRHSEVAMNFSVLTSIPVSKEKMPSIKREMPQKISLYWDTSLKIFDRDIGKEIDFLSSYLKELDKVHLEVISFNNAIVSKAYFEIQNGNVDQLLIHLNESHFEGAVNYSNVLKKNDFNADLILLFTDGQSVFEPLQPEIYVPIFPVNSLKNANHLLLQKTAFYADGHYINLSKVSNKSALEYILNDVEDKENYSETITDQSPIGDVNGKVFTASGAIQGATIRVKNTYTESQSDVDGFFIIDATEGDVLVVNFLGMLEKEVVVPESKEIYILMKSEGELLDEVVLTADGRKPEKVEGAFGKRNKDAIGYSINSISSDEIEPQYTDIYDLLKGKFGGVIVTPEGIVVRGGYSINNASYAIFDIEGAIYTSNPPYINPQDIENITILKSLAATTKYGTAGRGGVIKIKLKMGSEVFVDDINTALVKGNDYDANDVQLIGSLSEPKGYIKELQAAANYQEALDIYNSQKKRRKIWSVPYYLEVSEYFMKWDQDFGYSILTNIASVAYTNPKALKALAYKLEEFHKLEDAKGIYERLLELKPNHEQSYRDLALIYKETKDYDGAMTLYKQMLSNAIEGVDINGLFKTVQNELMHLLAFHKSKVDFSGLPNDYLIADFDYDLRLVFEWNDPNTEFLIQFVNPQLKYYRWAHSNFENKERLIDEINYGYHTEEFIIDDADPGEWILNIECLSPEDLLNPTYLKYTVYKNYGRPNETKEVKVIKLFEQKQMVTLDRFFYN